MMMTIGYLNLEFKSFFLYLHTHTDILSQLVRGKVAKRENVFCKSDIHITKGYSMMDMKRGRWIQSGINNEFHQMLDRGTSLVNGQDQIVQQRNHCFSSQRMASIDEKIKTSNQDDHDLISNRVSDHILLSISGHLRCLTVPILLRDNELTHLTDGCPRVL